MRKINIFLIAIIFLSAVCFADTEIMPVNQLKPGMTGYGLSVFKGTKIEKFPVTVVGITRMFNGAIETIIIKIDSGYCIDNKTGVAAGMSGSPVYINEKLIGAIAYGYPLTKSALCGVQPIEEMMKAFDDNNKEDLKPKASNLDKTIVIDGKKYNKVVISNNTDKEKNSYLKDELVLTPLTQLIMTNGLSAKSVDALNKEFGNQFTFKEGGGYYYENEKFDLSPGAAVGPVLVRGDISLTATGTLTYIKGNKYLAFGHNMFNMGKTDVPLGAYYIQTVVPSYLSSFKVSSLIKDIGSLTNDTISAIAGNFGGKSSMIPVSINLKDGSKQRTFNIEAARIESPVMWAAVRLAIGDAADTTLIPDAAGTVKANYIFTLSDGRQVRYKDIYYSDNYPIGIAQADFYDLAKFIAFNKFEKVEIKKVEVALDYERKNTSAQIEEIYITKNKIKSGGKAKLHVVIKPYNGNAFEKGVDINIPDNVSEGDISIGACGGVAYPIVERRLNISKRKITNFDQLVNYIEDHERNNELIVKVAYPKDMINISGKDYPFLPGYLMDIFARSSQSSVSIETETETYRINTPYYISNFQAISVPVSDGASTPVEKEKTKDKDEDKNKNDKTELGTFGVKIKNIKLDDAADTDKDKNNKDDADTAEKTKEKTDTQKEASKDDEKAPGEEKDAKKKRKEPSLPLTSSVFSDIEAKDFLSGKISGAAISDTAYIVLSQKKETIYKSFVNFIYACDYNEKNKYLVVADQKGNIVNANTGKIMANLGAGMINSVLNLPDGSILAAASPGGKIFKINPEGSVNLFCALPVKYVWKLKFNSGSIWAATGLPAKLYKISLDGKPQEYVSVNDAHIKSIDFKRDKIVLGTAEKGLVCVVNAAKKVTTLYQKDYAAVTGAAFDDAGNIYASMDYVIVKIAPSGAYYVYSAPTKDKYITALAVNENNEVLFGTALDGKIYKLLKNEETILLHNLECGAVFDISKDNAGNFYFTTGDPSSASVMSKDYYSSGEFTSRVFDLKDNCAIGPVMCAKEEKAKTFISMYTRTGQAEKPDNTWEAWKKIDLSAENPQAKSSPGNYFQYKIELRTQDAKITPKFLGMNFSYKNLYKLPYIDFVFPYTFDALSDKQDVEWICGDTNLDLTRFDLFYIKEGENKWVEAAMDIPVAVKKKDIKDDKNPISANQVYSWDTKKIMDGQYRLKLTAYNILDRNIKSEIISKPFTVSNSKPVIKITGKKLDGNVLTIEGRVSCKENYLKVVRFTFDEEIWYLANPKDGMYRGSEDNFIIKVHVSLENKNKKLLIEAEDQAGNKGEIRE